MRACPHCGSESIRRPFDIGFARMILSPWSIFTNGYKVLKHTFNKEYGYFQQYICNDCRKKCLECQPDPPEAFSKPGCGEMIPLHTSISYNAEYTCPNCGNFGLVKV